MFFFKIITFPEGLIWWKQNTFKILNLYVSQIFTKNWSKIQKINCNQTLKMLFGAYPADLKISFNFSLFIYVGLTYLMHDFT